MSDWTIEALAADLRARRISSVEVTQECLSRIRRHDSRLHAFITLDAEGALAGAKERDAELAARGPRGPLHGVPLAHKDLFALAGFATSCGTRLPEYFHGEGQSSAAARLVEAGAVTLGKLNMSELALGPFGDNAHHGDAETPWRRGHAAGGSSSGSGAAVAAGLALGALGTDTGGSIRLPAACCGVVGLKPTYGRVSRAGVMPLSWANDHVGPLTRTVSDAALMLAVIAGHDRRDATSSRRVVPDYLGALGRDVRGLRVGVPENYYFDGVEPDVARAVEEAARVLAGRGVRVSGLRLPDPQPLSDITNLISRAESAAIHARIIRERPGDLQPVVRARLELGLRISAHDYLQASRLRARLTRAFVREVFADVDALVVPTTPETAPALVDVKAGEVETVAHRMGRFSRLTRPFNGLGLPALSLPCGFSRDDLPYAMQVVGRPFDECTVLALAHTYEQAAGWWTRRPRL